MYCCCITYWQMFLRIVAGSDHIGCGMTAAAMVYCVLSIYVCFVCDLKEEYFHWENMQKSYYSFQFD